MEYNIYSINEAIYNLIELPDNATILDIGCRNAGYLKDILEKFPNKIDKAIGIDITDKHFDEVDYKSPIELSVMNCADGLAFEDNKFDLIIAKDVLECITDKSKFIKEIHRILKPNGTVICANADFDSITLNGKDKELIRNVIHSYAITKQPWMDDLDSWMGRRTYSIFNNTNLFISSVSIHSVIETEYEEGKMGYNYSQYVKWLVDNKTRKLSKREYQKFIDNLIEADKNGEYIFTKPYYIYKGIKK